MLNSIGPKFIFIYYLDTKPSPCVHVQDERNKPPREDFLSIHLEKKIQLERFKQLQYREVKTIKWACPAIMNTLHIANVFNYFVTTLDRSTFSFTMHQLTDS